VSYDVLVVGEVLVELSADGPLQGSDRLTLSFSGDALNAAAAAAAAGASVGLLARIGDDELGDALTAHVERCGVSTALLRRVREPNGMYIVIPDPDSVGGFVYMRRGSAGSTLSPQDVRGVSARALVVSGIGQAISESAAEAVEFAARTVSEAGGIVVYDPNFRARLTTEAAAREAFARIAPWVSVALPSHPVETRALLGVDTPAEAVAACRRLGVGAVAVTCGAEGVLVGLPAATAGAPGAAAEAPGVGDTLAAPPADAAGAGGDHFVPAPPVSAIVDGTGAGDAFAGTLAARLALGAEFLDAVGDGVAAAARSLGGRGGTGWITG
jgi:2-dehydro-3-deoxygluconokinase